MSKLLYIQASPRGQRSKSIKVADAFIAEYLQVNPNDNVETLNIFDSPITKYDFLIEHLHDNLSCSSCCSWLA